jgi:Na+-translocating ferredoxin:NAD+ oxidoreductase RnfG subunit
MLDILKLGLFLLVIAAVAGLGVGYVNSMTDPLIRKQALQAKIDSFKEIYPRGEEVKDESAHYLKSDTNPLIKEIDVAYKSGAPAGVIYLVEPKGYGGIRHRGKEIDCHKDSEPDGNSRTWRQVEGQFFPGSLQRQKFSYCS